MQRPALFRENAEWTIVGPLGPTVPNHLLSHCVLGVDGGAHHTSKLDVWVGDADSYEKPIQADHVFRHPKEKDFSDLALALSLFEEKLFYQFHLWGFSGGRFDHEIFNLGEILKFLKDHPESKCILYNEKGHGNLILLGAGDWEFNRHGTFSLGCLDAVKVQLTGQCKYQIIKESRIAPLSSYGLSNEGHGDITLRADGPLFIFYPETM